LKEPFISATRPSPVGLVRRVGPGGLGGLINIKPFATMWSALGEHFRDPRLRQLFGRYATYCGSSPYAGPGHADAGRPCGAGRGLVGQRRHAPARAIPGPHSPSGLAPFSLPRCEVDEIELERGRVKGVRLADGEELPADAVIVNGDTNAVAAGLFGSKQRAGPCRRTARSDPCPAVTWNLLAETSGFPLLHHTVFFSSDYPRSSTTSSRVKRLPRAPTVYICAQDRGATGESEHRPAPSACCCW
jgi:1-hydroxycarotenoid 3,4-desaturase